MRAAEQPRRRREQERGRLGDRHGPDDGEGVGVGVPDLDGAAGPSRAPDRRVARDAVGLADQDLHVVGDAGLGAEAGVGVIGGTVPRERHPLAVRPVDLDRDVAVGGGVAVRRQAALRSVEERGPVIPCVGVRIVPVEVAVAVEVVRVDVAPDGLDFVRARDIVTVRTEFDLGGDGSVRVAPEGEVLPGDAERAVGVGGGPEA